MSAAGPWKQLPSAAASVTDPNARRAITALEELVRQLQKRLADAERRLAAGGL